MKNIQMIVILKTNIEKGDFEMFQEPSKTSRKDCISQT